MTRGYTAKYHSSRKSHRRGTKKYKQQKQYKHKATEKKKVRKNILDGAKQGGKTAVSLVKNVIGAVGKIAHVGHVVTDLVDQTGFGDFARAVIPGYSLVDGVLDVADKGYEYGNRTLEVGRQVWDDSQWVASKLGVGSADYQSDISFNDRITRGLMYTQGYNEMDARSAMQDYQRRGMQTVQDYGRRIYNSHVDAMGDAYSSVNHYLTTNPLYEGGQHTYPTTGNTLVGNYRSALDSAYGARSVYQPYLDYNLGDKMDMMTQQLDVGGRLNELQNAVYGQASLYGENIAHRISGYGGNYGMSSMPSMASSMMKYY